MITVEITFIVDGLRCKTIMDVMDWDNAIWKFWDTFGKALGVTVRLETIERIK